MRDYEIASDLKQSKFENIKFMQYDNGSTITVNVFEDSQAVDLTNCTVLAKYKRADGKEFNRDSTVTDNKIVTTLDSTVTAVVGVLKIIFKITYDNSNKQASTFLLLAKIEENFGEGDSGNIGGNTDGNTEVNVDLSNYYNKQEINELLENLDDIVYISPTSFEEFVEMTSELGLFYVLSRNINITWENQTYNVIGLYDVRSHSNGYNYYGFQKMHQFVVNSTSKEITSFSSFRVYIENQIANDVELDENNLLYLVRDGAKIGTGITLPSIGGSSEKEWTLLKDVLIEEEVAATYIDTDTNNNKFSNITELLINVKGVPYSGNTTGYNINFYINGKTSDVIAYMNIPNNDTQQKYGVIYYKYIDANTAIDMFACDGWSNNTAVLNNLQIKPNASYIATLMNNKETIESIRIATNTGVNMGIGTRFMIYGR